MMPEERSIPACDWREYDAPDGKKYYYSNGKESQWVFCFWKADFVASHFLFDLEWQLEDAGRFSHLARKGWFGGAKKFIWFCCGSNPCFELTGCCNYLARWHIKSKGVRSPCWLLYYFVRCKMNLHRRICVLEHAFQLFCILHSSHVHSFVQTSNSSGKSESIESFKNHSKRVSCCRCHKLRLSFLCPWFYSVAAFSVSHHSEITTFFQTQTKRENQREKIRSNTIGIVVKKDGLKDRKKCNGVVEPIGVRLFDIVFVVVVIVIVVLVLVLVLVLVDPMAYWFPRSNVTRYDNQLFLFVSHYRRSFSRHPPIILPLFGFFAADDNRKRDGGSEQ